MSEHPTPRPGILGIAPYIGGDSKVAGVSRVIRLASNESALGPSPRAVAAYRAEAPEIFRYPDGGSVALRQAIALRHGLEPDRIVCGTGSDELISLLARAYSGAGDEVVYSRHGFLMYPIAAQAAGAKPVAVPEKRLTADVDGLLEHVSARTKLVYLANPNNPTGTFLPRDEVRRLHRGLPRSTIFVIDAAYAEFVARNDYEPGIELVQGAENVVMLRTFSKIYALAGLRVGWAYGSPEIVDVLNRVRGVFNINLPAQAAAVAALEDIAAVDRARAHNDIWRPWLERELKALGLELTPAIANFVLVHFGAGRKGSDAAWSFLQARGILTRKMGAYGLPEHVRITVGLEEEMRAVVAALADFLKSP
jgi:histidinol-phosphate aminotransferase